MAKCRTKDFQSTGRQSAVSVMANHPFYTRLILMMLTKNIIPVQFIPFEKLRLEFVKRAQM